MENDPFDFDNLSGECNSEEEFDEAIEGLIEKGLLEEVMIDGEICYQLTNIALQMKEHFIPVKDKSKLN